VTGGPPGDREPAWTPAALPGLAGRVALVTGATSGLGFCTALELARAGAHVVLACRDPLKGDEALGQVRVLPAGAAGARPAGGAAGPGRARPGSAQLYLLDLADLASIRGAADRFLREHGRLDLLVNNAGVMAVPQARTADGFELQFGTNHLGHVALTGHLLPALLRAGTPAAPARVVTVTSMIHRWGRVRRDDLMGQVRYRPWQAYAQSKLANLLFALELERRARAAGAPLASLAAHPGYAATNLFRAGPQSSHRTRVAGLSAAVAHWAGQSAEQGAWPMLRAATDPAVRGGEYYGPGRLGGLRGLPVRAVPSRRARHPDDAAWLWERSLALTGTRFEGLTALPR
jgi:NAD(P)-dependent dehydrogenase (short-subunit alcohol dehydrogenase family)